MSASYTAPDQMYGVNHESISYPVIEEQKPSLLIEAEGSEEFGADEGIVVGDVTIGSNYGQDESRHVEQLKEKPTEITIQANPNAKGYVLFIFKKEEGKDMSLIWPAEMEKRTNRSVPDKSNSKNC